MLFTYLIFLFVELSFWTLPLRRNFEEPQDTLLWSKILKVHAILCCSLGSQHGFVTCNCKREVRKFIKCSETKFNLSFSFSFFSSFVVFFFFFHCHLHSFIWYDCYVVKPCSFCCFIDLFLFFSFVGFAAVPPANNNFVTDNSFSSVFGNQDSKSGEYLIRSLSLFHEMQISFTLSLLSS